MCTYSVDSPLVSLCGLNLCNSWLVDLLASSWITHGHGHGGRSSSCLFGPKSSCSCPGPPGPSSSHLTFSLLSPWHRLMIIYAWLPKLLETSLRAVPMQQGATYHCSCQTQAGNIFIFTVLCTFLVQYLLLPAPSLEHSFATCHLQHK